MRFCDHWRFMTAKKTPSFYITYDVNFEIVECYWNKLLYNQSDYSDIIYGVWYLL